MLMELGSHGLSKNLESIPKLSIRDLLTMGLLELLDNFLHYLCKEAFFEIGSARVRIRLNRVYNIPRVGKEKKEVFLRTPCTSHT